MKIFQNKYFHFIVLLILSTSCHSQKNVVNSGSIPGYRFSKIDSKLILPDILLEVSGVTEIDDKTVACIQDENGILFIYSIIENKIVTQYKFDIDGDYEGITRVGNTIYILRSDGALLEILNYNSPDFSVTTYLTGIPANNNEGLCYDKANNQLLIACKGKLRKGSELKDIRAIYAFSLTTKRLSENPVFEFNTVLIKNFALEHNINLPTREKKNKKKSFSEPILRFRISAIGLHPSTGNLYVLSAADYLLMVFDKNGTILNAEKFDEKTFNKAEGIAFLKNGDMLITNEGQQGKPTLLRFNYSPKQ